MSEATTARGPYRTVSEALADAMPVRKAWLASPLAERGKLAGLNEAALRQSLAAAGVELGAYDEKILAWLADWEAETVQVIIGWIERAGLVADAHV